MKFIKHGSYAVFMVMMTLLFTACGGDKSSQKEQAGPAVANNPGGLTDFQMKNGVGPVTEKIVLGEIDPAKVEAGEALFKSKCAPCHRLDKRLVGPSLRYVADRRSPEYIMNMILNPDGMVKNHPEAKKVLGEYLSPMTNMNLKKEQVLELVDFFRAKAKEGKEKNIQADPLFRSQK